MNKAQLGVGQALGLVGKTREPAPSIRDALAVLANAISHYARVFAGTAIDDASLDRFEVGMQPLADLRDKQRQQSAATRAANAGQAEPDLFDLDIDLDAPLPDLGEVVEASDADD